MTDRSGSKKGLWNDICQECRQALSGDDWTLKDRILLSGWIGTFVFAGLYLSATC